MAACTCFCWRCFYINIVGGPVPTNTFKYKNCETGLDVFVTIPGSPTTPTSYVDICSQGFGGFISSLPTDTTIIPGSNIAFNANLLTGLYKVTNCLDPNDFFETTAVLNLYTNTGKALQFAEYPGCWFVTNTECTGNIVIPTLTITSPYDNCELCNAALPTIKNIVLTSCCGFSVYFVVDANIPYLNEANVYVYTGAPLDDGFGNTLYPNICYSYSGFSSLSANVTAPPLSSFTASQGVTCDGALCQNCFYKLTNCDNLAQILYTYNDLSLYIGQTITITGYPDICWTVEASTTAINPVAVTRLTNYDDCQNCKGYFFTINDCCTNEPYLINNQPVLLEYHGDADPGFAPADIKDLVITTINLPNGTAITGCFIIVEYNLASRSTAIIVGQTIIDWTKDLEFVTVPTCGDCQNCNTCYLLTNCVTGEVEYITGTDLLQYIGGVITIAGCKDQCWIVTQAENCDGCGGAVQVLSYFPSTDNATPQMCEYSIEFKNYTSITSATIIIDGTLYTLAATSLVTLVSSINALGLGTCYYGGGGLTGTVLLGITGDHVYGSLCVFGT